LNRLRISLSVTLPTILGAAAIPAAAQQPVSVVSHVKVLSDKVPDVSSIDADYRQPHGGFRPVTVTYTYLEDGRVKRDVHVARKPHETYTINCAAQPVMKSIALELAD